MTGRGRSGPRPAVWGGVLATGVLALGLGWFVSPFAGATRSYLRVRVVAEQTNEAPTTLTDQAAGFAARALAHAELLDPAGTLYGLRAAESVGNREWTFSFARSECISTDVSESCHDTGSVALLRVAASGDSFTVREAEGLSTEDSDVVEGYQEARRDRRPGWTFPQVVVHDRPGPPHFEGAALWEGPIGAVGLGSTCRPGLREAETGRVLWVAPSGIDLGSPQAPADRLGAVLTLGAVPQDVPESVPFVECDHWSDGGWAVEEGQGAALHQRPDGTSGYEVTATLAWVGNPFGQSFSECVFSVKTSSGVSLGSAVRTIPPRGRAGDMAETVVSELVGVRDVGAADHATVVCHKVSAQEFEKGGSR